MATVSLNLLFEVLFYNRNAFTYRRKKKLISPKWARLTRIIFLRVSGRGPKNATGCCLLENSAFLKLIISILSRVLYKALSVNNFHYNQPSSNASDYVDRPAMLFISYRCPLCRYFLLSGQHVCRVF